MSELLCYMSVLAAIASSRTSKTTIARRRLVGNNYRNDSADSDISENSAHIGSPPRFDQDFIIRHDITISVKARLKFLRFGDAIASKINKWKSTKPAATALVTKGTIKHIGCDVRVDDLRNPRFAEQNQITDEML